MIKSSGTLCVYRAPSAVLLGTKDYRVLINIANNFRERSVASDRGGDLGGFWHRLSEITSSEGALYQKVTNSGQTETVVQPSSGRMADLVISVALLVAIVFLSEATRRTTARLFSGRDYGIYLVETVSTFQLCACTHELKVLGEVGRIEPQIGLTLTYVITVIHVLTFHGAFCNPTGVLEHIYRKNIAWKSAAGLIACQFTAAAVAQFLAPYIWALGLSDLHLRHQRFGFKCFGPINGTLVEAAAVELACAFAVQAAVMHIHELDEKFRAHAIAAVITFLVYAGLSN